VVNVAEKIQALSERLMRDASYVDSAEIEADGIPVGRLIDWKLSPDGKRLVGEELDRATRMTSELILLDERMCWALCADGFWLLDDREAGEKLRYNEGIE
jgi:hypothetical protein